MAWSPSLDTLGRSPFKALLLILHHFLVDLENEEHTMKSWPRNISFWWAHLIWTIRWALGPKCIRSFSTSSGDLLTRTPRSLVPHTCHVFLRQTVESQKSKSLPESKRLGVTGLPKTTVVGPKLFIQSSSFSDQAQQIGQKYGENSWESSADLQVAMPATLLRQAGLKKEKLINWCSAILLFQWSLCLRVVRHFSLGFPLHLLCLFWCFFSVENHKGALHMSKEQRCHSHGSFY